MSNRIIRLEVRQHKVTSVEAELWIVAEVEQATPTTELRGRFVGPQCPGVSTVEVAYPVRPFARRPEGLPPTSARVVIPEPSLWGSEHPFSYRGVIELWQDGERCEQRIQTVELQRTAGAR